MAARGYRVTGSRGLNCLRSEMVEPRWRPSGLWNRNRCPLGPSSSSVSRTLLVRERPRLPTGPCILPSLTNQPGVYVPATAQLTEVCPPAGRQSGRISPQWRQVGGGADDHPAVHQHWDDGCPVANSSGQRLRFGRDGRHVHQFPDVDFRNGPVLGDGTEERLERNHLDVLFWAGAGLGGLAWVVCGLGAPLVADFYKTAALVPLCWVLGFSLLVNGLTIQPMALLKRQMWQRELAISQTGAVMAAGLVAVVLAVAGARVLGLGGSGRHRRIGALGDVVLLVRLSPRDPQAVSRSDNAIDIWRVRRSLQFHVVLPGQSGHHPHRKVLRSG